MKKIFIAFLACIIIGMFVLIRLSHASEGACAGAGGTDALHFNRAKYEACKDEREDGVVQQLNKIGAILECFRIEGGKGRRVEYDPAVGAIVATLGTKGCIDYSKIVPQALAQIKEIAQVAYDKGK